MTDVHASASDIAPEVWRLVFGKVAVTGVYGWREREKKVVWCLF